MGLGNGSEGEGVGYRLFSTLGIAEPIVHSSGFGVRVSGLEILTRRNIGYIISVSLIRVVGRMSMVAWLAMIFILATSLRLPEH